MGNYAAIASDMEATPPGIRKAGFREVVGVLRCPGHVGYAPSAAADAQLGFSIGLRPLRPRSSSTDAPGMDVFCRELRELTREAARVVDKVT